MSKKPGLIVQRADATHEEASPACPRCGAPDAAKLRKRRWICKACGHSFTADIDTSAKRA